jgi:hypothetical protein
MIREIGRLARQEIETFSGQARLFRFASEGPPRWNEDDAEIAKMLGREG